MSMLVKSNVIEQQNKESMKTSHVFLVLGVLNLFSMERDLITYTKPFLSCTIPLT